jgi:predicted HTH domain antitoxin
MEEKSLDMENPVLLEIPRDVLHATRMTVKELRCELAIQLFQQGRLSFGKARQMAEMNVWDFQQLLGSRGIPVHYDIEEYEADLRTIQGLERE